MESDTQKYAFTCEFTRAPQSVRGSGCVRFEVRRGEHWDLLWTVSWQIERLVWIRFDAWYYYLIAICFFVITIFIALFCLEFLFLITHCCDANDMHHIFLFFLYTFQICWFCWHYFSPYVRERKAKWSGSDFKPLNVLLNVKECKLSKVHVL